MVEVFTGSGSSFFQRLIPRRFCFLCERFWEAIVVGESNSSIGAVCSLFGEFPSLREPDGDDGIVKLDKGLVDLASDFWLLMSKVCMLLMTQNQNVVQLIYSEGWNGEGVERFFSWIVTFLEPSTSKDGHYGTLKLTGDARNWSINMKKIVGFVANRSSLVLKNTTLLKRNNLTVRTMKYLTASEASRIDQLLMNKELHGFTLDQLMENAGR